MAQQQMSLFGPSAFDIQRQQAQQDQTNAVAQAQLTPFQSIRASALMSGTQAGRSLAGLFGIEDPALSEAKKMEELKAAVAAQWDGNDPLEAYKIFAKEASARGLTQAAIGAATQIKAFEAERETSGLKSRLLQAQIGKTGAQQTQAEALAEKARKEQTTNPIGKVDPDKFTPESIQTFSETGNFRDLVVRPEKKDQFSEPYPITGADGKPILVQLNLQTRKVVPIDTASRVNVSASANVPKALKSIGDVRQQFNTNVKPYVTAANEAEQAEDMIDQASKGNFQGWRAAITQLAKSVGDSQISRAEIEAYGIDPSLIGSIVDRTSIFFSGTPSQDTINGAKKIATLVKKVNQDRAMKEQGTFLELAKEAEGYNPSKTPRFFELPFAPTTEGVREGTTSSGTKYKLTIK